MVSHKRDYCTFRVVENEQGYISKILCPKIVLDNASTRYSLQTKLDRQYALISYCNRLCICVKYYVRITAEVSQILVRECGSTLYVGMRRKQNGHPYNAM